MKTKYSIIIVGDNFSCGSSWEHAPIALGASGVMAVVAESYGHISSQQTPWQPEIFIHWNRRLGFL
ncbi:hypothetical protein Csa_000479, partial [Cucumis sativus]